MPKAGNVVALDVGTVRIGVAVADTSIGIAVPIDTIEVDGDELSALSALIVQESAQVVVVGYPRNQSGEPTQQTALVEAFAERLAAVTEASIVFQDESLTSVMAEDRLKVQGGPYSKADIDAHAAAIILQDYLEQHHV